MTKKYRHVLALCVFMGLAGCNKEDKYALPKTGEEVQSSEAASAVKAIPDREQVLAKVDQEMAELEQKVEETRKRSQQATGAAKNKLESEMSALDRGMQDLKVKLTGLKVAAADKWNKLKADLEQAMEHMKASIAKVSEGSLEKH